MNRPLAGRHAGYDDNGTPLADQVRAQIEEIRRVQEAVLHISPEIREEMRLEQIAEDRTSTLTARDPDGLLAENAWERTGRWFGR